MKHVFHPSGKFKEINLMKGNGQFWSKRGPEFRILLALGRIKRAGYKELQEISGAAERNFPRWLDGLERRKLIQRKRAPAFEAHEIELTEEGAKVVELLRQLEETFGGTELHDT